MTYTVSNDLDLLKGNIKYHASIGCSLFIIYLDNCSDDTYDYFSSFDNVYVFNTLVKPDFEINYPDYIIDLYDRIDEGYDIRKVINTFHSTKIVEKLGIDWLFSIDSDELVYKSDLLCYLDSLPNNIEQIRFRNIEVAIFDDQEHTFFEKHFFKRRPPKLIWILSRATSRLVRMLKCSGRVEELVQAIIYKLLFSGFGRLSCYKSHLIGHTLFNGYLGFKSAIRVSAVNDYVFSIHYWIPIKPRLNTVDVDYLLHFDTLGYEHFVSKFNKSQPLDDNTRFYFRKLVIDNARAPSDISLNFYHKFISLPSRYSRSNLLLVVDLSSCED